MKMLLPTQNWLRYNGYIGLQKAMQKHPALFAHIPMDKGRRQPEDWVPFAESLAAEHGGLLPCRSWLDRNGLSGLGFAYSKYKHVFAHIKQDSKHHNPANMVHRAEKIAAKHGGVLPSPGWLYERGYNWLMQMIRKFPDAFAHIKQESKKGRTPEEWVLVAERFVKRRGSIPNTWWLQQHGYQGLDTVMRKHRSLFKHLPQLKLATNGAIISKRRVAA